MVSGQTSQLSEGGDEGWLTVGGEEGNGRALGTGTTSTTDSVDVILRVVRVVVVQHMGNVANVFSKGKER